MQYVRSFALGDFMLVVVITFKVAGKMWVAGRSVCFELQEVEF